MVLLIAVGKILTPFDVANKGPRKVVQDSGLTRVALAPEMARTGSHGLNDHVLHASMVTSHNQAEASTASATPIKNARIMQTRSGDDNTVSYATPQQSIRANFLELGTHTLESRPWNRKLRLFSHGTSKRKYTLLMGRAVMR